jgi:hypothetical protein
MANQFAQRPARGCGPAGQLFARQGRRGVQKTYLITVPAFKDSGKLVHDLAMLFFGWAVASFRPFWQREGDARQGQRRTSKYAGQPCIGPPPVLSFLRESQFQLEET